MNAIPSKGRRSVFQILDDPDYGKRPKKRGKAGAPFVASAALDDEMRERLENVQRRTGLSGSDIIRQGLRRVFEEVERDGVLVVRFKQ